MDLQKDKVDTSKEIDGVWCDYDSETSFLIARYENPAHMKYMKKITKPYQRQFRMKTADDELVKKLEVDAMANCILLDWKGLNEGGKEVKFSIKKAKEVLLNPEYVGLLNYVQEQSSDMALFNVEELADGVVNLKKSSNGN